MVFENCARDFFHCCFVFTALIKFFYQKIHKTYSNTHFTTLYCIFDSYLDKHIPSKISFLIYSGSLFESSCDPKYWHGWKFNYYAADHGSSSTSQPHPVLELNERRPVYRNYRLLMNGTLYISKTAEEDEGKFICEADNGVNEPIGKLVALKVNGKYWMSFLLFFLYIFFTFVHNRGEREEKTTNVSKHNSHCCWCRKRKWDLNSFWRLFFEK